MSGMKAFVLFLLLVFGSSISFGRYVEVEDASERNEDRDETEAGELEEDPYGEEDADEQENRDAREEVVHIRGQSSEESVQEEDGDNDEDDENDDFDEEREEDDDLHDDRMMDRDEGGMPLAGQAEEAVPERTGFESFRKKVEEINKANEDMQAEINKLKTEFDKALSSDSHNGEGASDTSVESKSVIQHNTSGIYSSVNKVSEDTAEDVKDAGVQHRTYGDEDLVRQYSEMREDANITPDDDY